MHLLLQPLVLKQSPVVERCERGRPSECHQFQMEFNMVFCRVFICLWTCLFLCLNYQKDGRGGGVGGGRVVFVSLCDLLPGEFC